MKKRILIAVCAIAMFLSVMLASVSCTSGGIASAEINEDGELILIYDDGREQNLGIVVGRDGADGKDGIDGENGVDGVDGEDGADGKDGADGTNGSLTVTSGSDNIAIASAKGLRSAVSIICNFTATVQQGGWRPSTTTKEYASAGSGVIYSLDKSEGDAFIITNYHVVYDSSSNTKNGISEDINIYLYGSELEEKAIKATYIGGSLYYDISVLHVDNSEILKASDVCAVEIADSDKVSVGDAAIAIGNAKGFGISASFGIVSVDSEYITMAAADGKTEVSFRLMRVDTAVNSGNSGGGLYDGEGRLIGIVNAKIVDDGVENIGYAIPSNIAVSIAENIIDYCFGTDLERVQRAMLGIVVSAIDSKAVYDTASGSISINETVTVYEISESSLAYGALQAEDILLRAKLNGKTVEITRQYHIIDLMLDVRVGDTVEITILRGGEEKTVSVKISEGCLTEY